jgi:hypothetical protein
VTKEYEYLQMESYVDEVRRLERRFDGLEMEHVSQAMNTIAHELSKMAVRRELVPPSVFVERLTRPSVTSAKRNAKEAFPPDKGTAPAPTPGAYGTPTDDPELPLSMTVGGHAVWNPSDTNVPDVHAATTADKQAPPWADDLLRYIRDHTLPEDNKDAERVARQAKMYALIDEHLYQRRGNGVKLWCITREEGQALLKEIHEGICASHLASCALAETVFWQGFDLPTALSDAEYLVKTCDACQLHAKKSHQPAQALQTIPMSWLFAVWGLDIIGPFCKPLVVHPPLCCHRQIH